MASTQWLCPGSCYDTRKGSRVRHRDSAKHSRFVKVTVPTQEGGEEGPTQEVSHIDGAWVEVFVSCGKGEREGERVMVSDIGEGVVEMAAHLGPSPQDGGLVIWRAGQFQNLEVGPSG